LAAALAAATATAMLAAAGARAQGADEHSAAQALVTQLEHDSAHAAVTAEALANAKGALERATRIRMTGDEAHAKAADGLALEWAQVARDLAKASDAETTAAELRRKAVSAQEQLERTRALVEEGIARVGRLQAELAEAERVPRTDRVAVEVHDDKADKAGDKGPPKKGGATRHTPRDASQGQATGPKAQGGAP
jgi:hypothetical protein